MQVLQNTQLSFSLKLMGKVKSVTDFMPQGRFTQCRNLFLNNWIPLVTLDGAFSISFSKSTYGSYFTKEVTSHSFNQHSCLQGT